MNKRFYSIIAKNSKLYINTLFLLLAIVFQNSLSAQTVLYTENMDNGSGGANGDLISTHQANGRFEQLGLTYSGSGDMRTTLPSEGYTDATGNPASGGFNVMLNNAGETFTIDGLDLTSCLSDIVISFGLKKNTNNANGSLLNLQYSTNGIAGPYSTITFQLLPTGAGSAIPYYYVSTTSSIPSEATTIRFSSLDGTEYRIDDIVIACNTTDCVPPTITRNPTDVTRCEDENVRFISGATGTGITYQWQVDMGAGFVDVVEDATYIGATNDTLDIIGTIGDMNGYIFRCVATGACGVENSNTATLTVNAVPTPIITPSGPTDFCTGGSVLLTSSATTGNLWNNTTSSTTQSIIVSQSGEYIVRVAVGLCFKNSAPTKVTVENATFTIGELTNPTLCGTTDGEIKLVGLAEQAGNITYGTFISTYPDDPIVPNVTEPATMPHTLSGLVRGDWVITFTTELANCVYRDTVTLTSILPPPTINHSFQLLTPAPEYRAEFCQPDSIRLTSSSLTDNTWESWSNGVWTDIATTRAITVKATDTLRVRVNSGSCIEYSDTAFITVNRQPIISVVSFLDPTVCALADGSVLIEGDTIGTLHWLGSVNGSQMVDLDIAPNTFDVTGLSAGLYKFVLNDGTCASDTITQTLTDPGAPATPVLTAGGPTTFCIGDDVELSYVPDADPTVNYTWYNGGTDVQTGGLTYTATVSGTYTVRAEKAGCTSTSNAEVITVHVYPDLPVITSSDDNDTICKGSTATLTSTFGPEFLWLPTNETTQSITAIVGADYTVAITENGCTTTSEIYKLVEVDTTILITGSFNDPSICGSADGTIQILGLKDSQEKTDSLSWTGPVVNSVDNITLPYVITSLSSGDYEITFTTLGGCVALASYTLNDPISTPIIQLATSDTVDFCSGNDVTLISSSSVGNQWNWNGNPIDGATGQTFTTDSSGVYSVTVNINSCSVTSLDTIVTVFPLPIISEGIITPPTACGESDATVEIILPVIGDLTWTGPTSGSIIGAASGTQLITGLRAGLYTFIFDSLCTSSPLMVTIEETSTPDVPMITADGPTTFCVDNGNGSVTLSVTNINTNGGTYTWSNGAVGTSTTVSSTSNYYVDVTEGQCTQRSEFLSVSVVNNPLAPTIVANGPTTFCQGSEVLLTASASNGITWSNGETTSSVTINANESLTATLTENGCVSPASNPITVTVNTLPVISLGASNNPSTCGGTEGSIVILGTATGNLSWTGSANGTANNITLPFTISGLTAGTYSITLNDGCPSNTVATSLSDPNAPAIPTITDVNNEPLNPDNLTFCEGGSVVLRSSAPNSSNNVWNTTPVVTTRNLTVTQTGTYFVTVNVNGCSASSLPVTVVVNPIPATPSIIAQGPTTFCSGGNVNLAASTAVGLSWTPGGSTNQVINVTATNTFSVTTTENGCTSASSAPVTVTVNSIPPVPTIASSTGSNSFCEGSSINLISSANNGNTWSNGQSASTITVNNSGTFFVTVTVNGCSSTSANFTVTENNQPGALLPPYNVLCDTLPSFDLNQGVPTDITPNVIPTAAYTVNGNAATTFNPSALGEGNYTVVYTVTEGSCSASATQVISVIHCEPVTGLDENAGLVFMIYPNPASSFIHIDGDQLSQIKNVSLVDGLGRTVLTNDGSLTSIKLDVSNLSNGMYSLIIKGDTFESVNRVQILK
jgi:large repetitive protein